MSSSKGKGRADDSTPTSTGIRQTIPNRPFIDPLIGNTSVEYDINADIRTPQNTLKESAEIGDLVLKALILDIKRSKLEPSVISQHTFLTNKYQRKFLKSLGFELGVASDHHCGTLFEYHFAGNGHFRWRFVKDNFPTYYQAAVLRARESEDQNE